MIKLTTYKNRPAINFSTKSLSATFLPFDGAKLCSLIKTSNLEELLVVKSGNEYKRLDYNGDYVSSECSGFDDMFPTVDPFTVTDGEYKGITYPDHGETCRIPYDYELTENKIIFRAKSKLFPITYVKEVSEENDEIILNYVIKNEGSVQFEYLWAGHIMLKGNDDTKIITPFNEDTPVEFMFSSKGFDVNLLPKNKLIKYQPQIGSAYKFYYLEKIKKGEFSLAYGDGSLLKFSYDKDKLPYLGIWLNNGEFQNLYSITPEPCTAPFDSPNRAKKRGYSSIIDKNSELNFKISISLKE